MSRHMDKAMAGAKRNDMTLRRQHKSRTTARGCGGNKVVRQQYEGRTAARGCYGSKNVWRDRRVDAKTQWCGKFGRGCM